MKDDNRRLIQLAVTATAIFPMLFCCWWQWYRAQDNIGRSSQFLTATACITLLPGLFAIAFALRRGIDGGSGVSAIVVWLSVGWAFFGYAAVVGVM